MDYLVRYTAHINERIRPEGFPKKVLVNVVLSASDREQLNTHINNFAGGFIAQQAVVALKDPLAVQARELDLEKRMIVPFAMISHIDCEVFPVTGQVPVVNNGKLVTYDKEGNETEVKPN